MNDCIFCKIILKEIPASIVYEDDQVLAFLDINPVNPGHTLVIPKVHYENIFETPDTLFGYIAQIAKKIAHAIKDGLGAPGVNVAMNNGAHAGQVVFHAHVHVMPRHEGDGYALWKGRAYKEHEPEDILFKIKQSLK